jgi:hypothetical protein
MPVFILESQATLSGNFLGFFSGISRDEAHSFFSEAINGLFLKREVLSLLVATQKRRNYKQGKF